ncbi:hypothetical protein V2J09_003389 [Rumex salicifolius]
MNRQGEEEFEYDSSSAPSTPKNSEGNDEKKKQSRVLKKLFTKKKSANNLDKSPSISERGLVRDEGGGSESRRRSLPGFFKFGRSSKNDESKSSESQSYNEKTSETLLEKNKTNERDSRVEPSKEETEREKHNTLADRIGEEIQLLAKAKEDTQKNLDKPIIQATIDDKGKPKEHEESQVIANVGQGKEVVKHDLQHHHKQAAYPNGDVKEEEKLVAPESKTVTEESRELASPSPTPLHEKESVGCESLAQGLQNVCLPWTVKKDDH